MAGTRFDLEPSIKALLRDLGVSVPRVLGRAELPSDLFARRPIELSVAEYYRFWSALDAEAVAAGRTDIAVELGNAISAEMFSPPMFAALCSPNLATAATRLAAHKPLVGPLRIDVDTDHDGRLTIALRWPTAEEPPPLLAAGELVFWVALARIGTRESIHPTAVTAPASVRPNDALRSFLGTRPTTSETTSLTFTALDANRPFLTENDQMWQVFAPDLRRRLFDLQAAASVADRVRAALLETLPGGDPSISGVTSELAVSPRTLQRRLRDEGTTFQTVLADTRQNLARHYLRQRDVRTSEIAYLLGYADTNSFYRAFKSWTGTTPEAARLELAST
ncbi:helix-turn-helix domain-containing protein [Pimelobacter simplex]|uniref:AraC family transcriptional regulator n=1 Tax=Nocardioides simplex TaxID=2045 RepID=UPI003AB02CA2